MAWETTGDQQLLGVTFDANRGKWKARIHFEGQERYIGRYNSSFDAALAYDQAARQINASLMLGAAAAAGTAAERNRRRARQLNFPDMSPYDPAVNDPAVERRMKTIFAAAAAEAEDAAAASAAAAGDAAAADPCEQGAKAAAAAAATVATSSSGSIDATAAGALGRAFPMGSHISTGDSPTGGGGAAAGHGKRRSTASPAGTREKRAAAAAAAAAALEVEDALLPAATASGTQSGVDCGEAFSGHAGALQGLTSQLPDAAAAVTGVAAAAAGVAAAVVGAAGKMASAVFPQPYGDDAIMSEAAAAAAAAAVDTQAVVPAGAKQQPNAAQPLHTIQPHAPQQQERQQQRQQQQQEEEAPLMAVQLPDAAFTSPAAAADIHDVGEWDDLMALLGIHKGPAVDPIDSFLQTKLPLLQTVGSDGPQASCNSTPRAATSLRRNLSMQAVQHPHQLLQQQHAPGSYSLAHPAIQSIQRGQSAGVLQHDPAALCGGSNTSSTSSTNPVALALALQPEELVQLLHVPDVDYSSDWGLPANHAARQQVSVHEVHGRECAGAASGSPEVLQPAVHWPPVPPQAPPSLEQQQQQHGMVLQLPQLLPFARCCSPAVRSSSSTRAGSIQAPQQQHVQSSSPTLPPLSHPASGDLAPWASSSEAGHGRHNPEPAAAAAAAAAQKSADDGAVTGEPGLLACITTQAHALAATSACLHCLTDLELHLLQQQPDVSAAGAMLDWLHAAWYREVIASGSMPATARPAALAAAVAAAKARPATAAEPRKVALLFLDLVVLLAADVLAACDASIAAQRSFLLDVLTKLQQCLGDVQGMVAAAAAGVTVECKGLMQGWVSSHVLPGSSPAFSFLIGRLVTLV